MDKITYALLAALLLLGALAVMESGPDKLSEAEVIELYNR